MALCKLLFTFMAKPRRRSTRERDSTVIDDLAKHYSSNKVDPSCLRILQQVNRSVNQNIDDRTLIALISIASLVSKGQSAKALTKYLHFESNTLTSKLISLKDDFHSPISGASATFYS